VFAFCRIERFIAKLTTEVPDKSRARVRFNGGSTELQSAVVE